MVKMAVVAPMPSASVATMMAVDVGQRRSELIARRVSESNASIEGRVH